MWIGRFLLFFLLAAFARADGAGDEERVYRWPAGHEGKQRLAVMKLEAPSEWAIAYETDHYRFYADTEISSQDWRSIMIVCEGLHGAMVSLPLDLLLREEGKERRCGTVRLFGEEEVYHGAGGLEGTVGTYSPRGGEVLIWTKGLIER